MSARHAFAFAFALKSTGLAGLLFGGALLSGCREEMSEESPVQLQRNMFHQERYNPQSESHLFSDKRTMRQPPEGTVPREQSIDNDEVNTGLTAGGTYVLTIPPAAVQQNGDAEKMVKRGQERFAIYCVPCHDSNGTGKGMVARAPNGFPPLPSFHENRIKQMPDGQMFATITNGVRNMPAYQAQIPISDRWAIVAYVRALEMTQLTLLEPKQ